MHTVFLDQQTFSKSISLAKIQQQVTALICYQTTNPNQVIERCRDAEIIITNKVVLNADTLQQLPKLKLICIAATGINNVDIKAAKQLKIAVTNVSGYAKQSVAQYVFAQMLEYFNQINHHQQNSQNGLWQQSPTFCVHGNGSIELAGKALGIVGYGSLGKAVAHIAKAFEMKVLVAERPNATTTRKGRLAFNDVLKQADVLSLHCPQTAETENLINQERLSVMKDNAMLINTARGALVNNNDLLIALKTGEIAYAVLDVLEEEPPPADHILLNAKCNNLKITAHIAWASAEAQQRLINLLADNIHSFKGAERLNRID